jgi:hypothetical protein
MSSFQPTADSPLSPEGAVAAVWGPNRVWLAVAAIIAGGLVGAGLAMTRPVAWEGLRGWACAGYGVVIGGLLSLLPRFMSIVMLGSALNRHAVADNPARPWWPLVLVASALRDTPALRRTSEDFRTAVNAFIPQARGLLGQRLWPACAAAFTAPVLGLVSAWVSWRIHLPEAVRLAKESAQKAELAEAVPAVDWGLVAWPMIITIALSLVLMLGIVLADQLTRRLLQRWASAVGPLDAESPFVEARLASMAESQLGTRTERVIQERPLAEPRPGPIAPLPAAEKPRPQVSAEELQELGKLFRDG